MPKPVIAQKGPYILELEPGWYSCCTCGKSKTQPFCDSSHREDGEFRSLKFKIEEKGEYYICGCKQTGSPPFCNDTHEDL